MSRRRHPPMVLIPGSGPRAQVQRHRVQVGALFQAAVELHAQGQLDAALTAYKALMQRLGPEHPVAQSAAYQTSLACYQRRLYDEAILLMRFYLSKRWEDPNAHYNLGNFYEAYQQPELAAESYRVALAIQPDHSAAENNLANTLRKLGDLETAELCYQRILQRDPQDAPSRYNLSYVLLLRGQLQRGFALYEERWRCENYVAEYVRREITSPRLQRDTPPCRVFVHQEQGLGDSLMMLRFLPSLVAMGHEVIVEAPAEFAAWWGDGTTLAPGIRVHGRRRAVHEGGAADQPSVPAHDAHLPMMSLPWFLGVAEERDIPPVLAPPVPQAARERLRSWLAPDLRPLVGICWAGRPSHHNDAYRSMRAADLQTLLARPDTQFVSLQVGPRGLELLTELPRLSLGAGSDLLEVSAQLATFADTAALIEACDAVVTVDTSIAHVAGTLGVPTFVQTSWLSEWRWLLEGERTPWYPSVRLMRQPSLGDWTTPITETLTAMEALWRSRW